jgi:hypothetical protein
MKLIVTAIPIYRGKVIDGLSVSSTLESQSILNEDVGRVVLQVVANGRKAGWHFADPEIWIRVEFKQSEGSSYHDRT